MKRKIIRSNRVNTAATMTPIAPGFYRTRTGKKARVLCVDAPGDYTVLGYLEGQKGSTPKQWRLSGQAHVNGDDLVEVWVDNRSVTVDLYIMLDTSGAAIVSYTPPKPNDVYLGVTKTTVTVTEGDIEGIK